MTKGTIKVFIPTQLRNYTNGATQVPASGTTVDEALTDIDQRYPGIRFRVVDEQNRIRQHMRIFVDGERIQAVSTNLAAATEVHVFGALSGG